MKLKPPITDDDIEALLSGSLAPARRHVVEEHLSLHPEQQARVDALRADQDSLRALGAELLHEPLPERFLRLLSPDAENDDEGTGNREEFAVSREVQGFRRRLGA